MISGGMKINQFAQIRLFLKMKFGDNPLLYISLTCRFSGMQNIFLGQLPWRKKGKSIKSYEFQHKFSLVIHFLIYLFNLSN